MTYTTAGTVFLPLMGHFSRRKNGARNCSVTTLAVYLLAIPFVFADVLKAGRIIGTPPSRGVNAGRILNGFFGGPPLLVIYATFLICKFLGCNEVATNVCCFACF